MSMRRGVWAKTRRDCDPQTPMTSLCSGLGSMCQQSLGECHSAQYSSWLKIEELNGDRQGRLSERNFQLKNDQHGKIVECRYYLDRAGKGLASLFECL